MMSGPATGRRSCVLRLRAVLPCLALIACDGTQARAPNADARLCSGPCRDGFVSPQDLPLRRTRSMTAPRFHGDAIVDDRRAQQQTRPAPSRIGQIPTYGLPAASGAADSGYDSLNRTRKKPKLYPGQAKPKAPPVPAVRRRCRRRSTRPGIAAVDAAVADPPTSRRSRRRWPAP